MLSDKLKSAGAELVIYEWERNIGNNVAAFAAVVVANREESAFSLVNRTAVSYGGAGLVDRDDLIRQSIDTAIGTLIRDGGLDTALAQIRRSEFEHGLDAMVDHHRVRAAQTRKGGH
ncbi:MAG: hypothetical protein ACREP2_13555 [Rhodanobacteraceae bacterium]